MPNMQRAAQLIADLLTNYLGFKAGQALQVVSIVKQKLKGAV